MSEYRGDIFWKINQEPYGKRFQKLVKQNQAWSNSDIVSCEKTPQLNEICSKTMPKTDRVANQQLGVC